MVLDTAVVVGKENYFNRDKNDVFILDFAIIQCTFELNGME